MVFFDLPTETKKERRDASTFRKELVRNGFSMFQFSVYLRHCASSENMEVHRQRVKKLLPPKGHVGILSVTDKQFGRMDTYFNAKEKPELDTPAQLELF